MIGDELAQHRDEHVDGVRRVSLLIGQSPPAKRVIGAVHLRAAVDKKQCGAGHGTERTHEGGPQGPPLRRISFD